MHFSQVCVTMVMTSVGFKYLGWVKFHHNTAYHTTIKMSPFEAVYNRKPIFDLSSYSIPSEHWDEIEQDDELGKMSPRGVVAIIIV